MLGSWSQDPVMVSKYITNIEKIIMRRRIINNIVLPIGRGIAVLFTRYRNESRVNEKRHEKSNMSGPIPPSNHSF